MVEAFRLVTIVLGGAVIAAAGEEAARFFTSYRHDGARLDLWRSCQRAGTVLGIVFILGELSGRLNNPYLTWRTPLAFCVFCLVLAGVVGIGRNTNS